MNTIFIPQEIFRTYDIRGVVGETLTTDIVKIIAIIIGKQAQKQNQHSVIVARDGRLSGPQLSESLIEGLLLSGCKVIDIGAVPTPLLYFATNILSSQSGIMLTGSHNPANYNGLKIIIAGETLSENKIQAIYQDILSESISADAAKIPHIANVYAHKKYQKNDITQDYISAITNHIQLPKKMKIVIDAGNGIAGIVAPQLFRELGCEVIELFCDVDGHFPNHHPDPSVPSNLEDLINAVKKYNADIGLAFDGDGDRLGVVTNQGEIIFPDRQLMLYSKDVLSRNPGEKILYDVKCTQQLDSFIKKHHGIPEMTKTGHSLIKKKLYETKAPLAGEMSGHIFFKDRWYGFDDGLYTGARLLEILSHTPQTCSEIFQGLPNSVNTPELKLSVSDAQRKKILAHLPSSLLFKNAKLITIDGCRVEFENGWGLVRGSNTTPHLILRFEAEDQKSLLKIQQYFKQALLALDDTLNLPF